MSAESLEKIVARAEAALVAGVNAPGCRASIPVADLRRLLTELERARARR